MMRGQTMDEWMKEDDNGNDRDAVMVAKSSNLIIHHFSLTNRHCMSSNARLREINEDINKLISTIIKRTFIVTYTHARTRSRKMGCLQSEKFAFFTHLSIGNYSFFLSFSGTIQFEANPTAYCFITKHHQMPQR